MRNVCKIFFVLKMPDVCSTSAIFKLKIHWNFKIYRLNMAILKNIIVPMWIKFSACVLSQWCSTLQPPRPVVQAQLHPLGEVGLLAWFTVEKHVGSVWECDTAPAWIQVGRFSKKREKNPTVPTFSLSICFWWNYSHEWAGVTVKVATGVHPDIVMPW